MTDCDTTGLMWLVDIVSSHAVFDCMPSLLLVWNSIRYKGSTAGPLAQSVERRADNAKAVSSSLTWTIFFSMLYEF